MSRLGPYVLVRRLAIGGMAEVFLARREGPGGFARVVALKRILPHLAELPDFVAMFLDEARLAARLVHPHIVQVHDCGHADGAYFLAMEYVAGEDVASILRRAAGAPVPPVLAAAILAAGCDALHAAHETRDEEGAPLGIVHRDVTPSNLLVSYDGVVKLTDFGIAKAERRTTRTEAGARKGKYPYMSPEQARGDAIDRRSDLFSLGIVGHELLTGTRLFERDNPLAVLEAITRRPIPRARDLRPDVPAELDEVIARALARDPDARFATAQEMQLALEEFLVGCRSGSAGVRLQLAAWLADLFGPDAARERRRWAAGELDEVEPTCPLPTDAAPVDAADEERETEATVAAAPSALAPSTGAPDADGDAGASPGGPWSRVDAAPEEGTFVERHAAVDHDVRPGADARHGGPHGPRADGADAADEEPHGGVRGGIAAGERTRAGIPSSQEGVARRALDPVRRVVRLAAPLAAAAALASWAAGAHRPPPDVAARRAAAPTVARGAAVPAPSATAPDPQAGEKARGAQPLTPPPTPPARTAAAAAVVPRPGGTRGVADTRVTPATGLLTVATSPGTEVLLDGRPLGTAPIRRRRVAAGRHVVTLVTVDGGRVELPVTVPAGAERVEERPLGEGRIALDAEPWADVWVGARKLGTTPLGPTPLTEGTYVLRLHNPERGEERVQVTVRTGEVTRLKATIGGVP